MNRIKLAVSKDATVPGEPTGTDAPTVGGNKPLKAIAKAATPEFEAHRKAERIHPIVFPAPHFPQPFAPAIAPPPAPVPRPPLDPAEAVAWRHVVFVLSKTASPTKRKIMADRLNDLIRGRGTGELGLELPDVAALFHPNSPKDAATVLASLQQAIEAGTLASHGHFLLISQLAAWPDIPAPATDSPLRFWLQFLPNAAAAPEAGQTTAADLECDANETAWFKWCAARNAANTNPDGTAKKGRSRAPWTLDDLLFLRRRHTHKGGDAAATNAIAADLKTSPQAVAKQLDEARARGNQPARKVI